MAGRASHQQQLHGVYARESYSSEIMLTQPFNMTVVDVTQTQDCSESEEEGNNLIAVERGCICLLFV